MAEYTTQYRILCVRNEAYKVLWCTVFSKLNLDADSYFLGSQIQGPSYCCL